MRLVNLKREISRHATVIPVFFSIPPPDQLSEWNGERFHIVAHDNGFLRSSVHLDLRVQIQLVNSMGEAIVLSCSCNSRNRHKKWNNLIYPDILISLTSLSGAPFWYINCFYFNEANIKQVSLSQCVCISRSQCSPICK